MIGPPRDLFGIALQRKGADLVVRCKIRLRLVHAEAWRRYLRVLLQQLQRLPAEHLGLVAHLDQRPALRRLQRDQPSHVLLRRHQRTLDGSQLIGRQGQRSQVL
ncbi:hypothetical protein ACFPPA_09195 [Rhodanobacter ginsengisoli]|uniref:Uncharacterized protein n=1 Tax=Rhodanobacter ginsengisoli TaxID=418646 RepID=A0ABW0QLV3_9GAMM